MPVTQDLWELPADNKEQKEAAAKYGVKMGKTYKTGREFFSNSVTIKGKKYTESDGENNAVENYDESNVRNWAEGQTEEIPGLHCPDCDAQAYKTDHPHVAVCGDYPGWYFFFRRKAHDAQASTKLVIKNGQLVEVESSSIDSTT